MLGCGSNTNSLTADRPNRTNNKLINAALQIQTQTKIRWRHAVDRTDTFRYIYYSTVHGGHYARVFTFSATLYFYH